jgi:signal transduction histidine kinase
MRYRAHSAASALTQRMLAFARRQELKLQTINVTELVNGMTELLQSSLRSSIHIETHFSIGLPKVSADANQLELAILNLTMNARDAMPKGGTIVISARERTVEDEPGLKCSPSAPVRPIEGLPEGRISGSS